jgi:hypothetical protein
VTRFEASTPFEYRTEFYRLTDRVVPSLRYHHYANSNSWSSGPEDRFRYGRLGFAFNGRDLAFEVLGRTAEGTPTLRQITWDADADRFRGVPFQTVDGRELYRVDKGWSQDFEALPLKPETALITGGPQSYNFWSDWTVVVPGKKPLNLRLNWPAGEDGKVPALALNLPLEPGYHSVHLQVKPFPKESKVRVAIRIDKQPEQVFERAGELSNDVDLYPVVRTVEGDASTTLFSQSLNTTVGGAKIELSITPPAEAK